MSHTEISLISGPISMEIGHGEAWVRFDARDSDGNTSSVSIDSSALIALAEHHAELLQGLLLEQINRPQSSRSVLYAGGDE